MKKVLISVLIVLLVIMAYFAIFKGISMGTFKILSIEQITNENDNLTEQIAQTEKLMSTDYQTATGELDKSIDSLLIAKQEYYDLANVSTEGEIKEANQEEEYTLEFLWTNLGRHSTAEGVNLTYTMSSGTTGNPDVKNITFSVTGDYAPVIKFVTALEDDSKLGFRIYNFKLVPGGSHLQATFLVMNVRIKSETVSGGTTTGTGQEQAATPDQTTSPEAPTTNPNP